MSCSAPRIPALPEHGVAWVTGASSGLGQAVALELVRRGWRVAVSARRADLLAALVAQHPAQIAAWPLDIVDGEAVGAAVADIEAAWGPLDLAVLNAGCNEAELEGLPDAALFARVVGVNAVGTSHCLAAVSAGMVQRGSGRIAVVGSLAGCGPLPTAAAYGASKAALVHLTGAFHRSLRRRGVLLQLVLPGFVRTAMVAHGRFPLPGLMEPEEAARRLLAGMATDVFEVAFPRPLSWVTKAAQWLPRGVYLALADRLVNGRF